MTLGGLWIKPLLAISFGVFCTACSAALFEGTPGMEVGMDKVTELPQPRSEGLLTLEEALHLRRSVRSYRDEPLSLAELSQLLWAAQGVSDRRGLRTAPSAGALYPLEIYAVTHEGVFHYFPHDHAIALHREGDLRRDLCGAALNQEAVCEAPMTMVITAVYSRIEVKYGRDRTPRYVHIEVGHAAQNVLLQAVSLDLGAVPIGAFEDRRVQSVLGLPDDHEPLYLISIGYPE